jgi:hypothetical protein
MGTIVEIAWASWRLFQESALYILIGFMAAGLLRAWFRPESVSRYFYLGRVKSVVYASLLGIPVPL